MGAPTVACNKYIPSRMAEVGVKTTINAPILSKLCIHECPNHVCFIVQKAIRWYM